jgi:hypothetical protein
VFTAWQKLKVCVYTVGFKLLMVMRIKPIEHTTLHKFSKIWEPNSGNQRVIWSKLQTVDPQILGAELKKKIVARVTWLAGLVPADGNMLLCVYLKHWEKIHYFAHNFPPLDCVLSQMNPVHLTFHILKIHFSILSLNLYKSMKTAHGLLKRSTVGLIFGIIYFCGFV